MAVDATELSPGDLVTWARPWQGSDFLGWITPAKVVEVYMDRHLVLIHAEAIEGPPIPVVVPVDNLHRRDA